MIRPAVSTVMALLALAGAAVAAEAQPVRNAAEGFASAWGEVDATALRIRFHDPTRLTMNGVARTGLRPEQSIAAVRTLLRAHEQAVPRVVRADVMESREGAGFAELSWATRDLASGTPVQRTILITFTRVDTKLLVSDLRILP